MQKLCKHSKFGYFFLYSNDYGGWFERPHVTNINESLPEEKYMEYNTTVMKKFNVNMNIYNNYESTTMYSKKMMIYFNYHTQVAIERDKFGKVFGINAAYKEQLRFFTKLNTSILDKHYKNKFSK